MLIFWKKRMLIITFLENIVEGMDYLCLAKIISKLNSLLSEGKLQKKKQFNICYVKPEGED